MHISLTRILKVLCSTAVVAMLSACGGATSTVDPFKPSRVIGLGDGFNNLNRTIAPTVADQVAANFGLGLSSVVNKGSDGATITNLASQITGVINSDGGFTSGDLVVISVGTFDVRSSAIPTAYNEVPELVRQVQRLLELNVKHVLVMPVLDVSRTPWGSAHNFEQGSVPATNSSGTFNGEILSQLAAHFGGLSPNPVIYANSGTSPISYQFLSMTATTPIWVSPFNCFSTSTATCNNNSGASADTSLFDTSDTYLTPAGNIWVANLLYNATVQGWR